jgi:hypothetical protein
VRGCVKSRGIMNLNCELTNKLEYTKERNSNSNTNKLNTKEKKKTGIGIQMRAYLEQALALRVERVQVRTLAHEELRYGCEIKRSVSKLSSLPLLARHDGWKWQKREYQWYITSSMVTSSTSSRGVSPSKSMFG